MSDIRIKFTLFQNTKTRKLQHILGSEAVLCLIRLWVWAAQNRPKGIFYNEDAIDVALAAEWPGDAESYNKSSIRHCFSLSLIGE